MYYMIMNIICRTDSKELELQTNNIDKLRYNCQKWLVKPL